MAFVRHIVALLLSLSILGMGIALPANDAEAGPLKASQICLHRADAPQLLFDAADAADPQHLSLVSEMRKEEENARFPSSFLHALFVMAFGLDVAPVPQPSFPVANREETPLSRFFRLSLPTRAPPLA